MCVARTAILGFAMLIIGQPGWAAKNVRFSGFLDDYNVDAPYAEQTGVLAQKAPDFHMRSYGQFIFEPNEIRADDPDSEYKGAQPHQLNKITDGLLEVIANELKDGNPIVDKPGPGMAIARLALTYVYVEKEIAKRHYYTPTGAVSKGVQTAAGKTIALTTAHMQIELLDSQSGQRLNNQRGIPSCHPPR